MPLSEHDETQFRLLTSNLTFDDSDLKKMAKVDNAGSITYVILPSRNTILMLVALVALVAMIVSSVGLIIVGRERVADNISLFIAFAASSVLLLVAASLTTAEQSSAANRIAGR